MLRQEVERLIGKKIAREEKQPQLPQPFMPAGFGGSTGVATPAEVAYVAEHGNSAFNQPNPGILAQPQQAQPQQAGGIPDKFTALKRYGPGNPLSHAYDMLGEGYAVTPQQLEAAHQQAEAKLGPQAMQMPQPPAQPQQIAPQVRQEVPQLRQPRGLPTPPTPAVYEGGDAAPFAQQPGAMQPQAPQQAEPGILGSIGNWANQNQDWLQSIGRGMLAYQRSPKAGIFETADKALPGIRQAHVAKNIKKAIEGGASADDALDMMIKSGDPVMMMKAITAKAQAARSLNKPIVVGNQIVTQNPEGGFTPVYQGPTEGQKSLSRDQAKKAADMIEAATTLNQLTESINGVNEIHSKRSNITGPGPAVSATLGLSQDQDYAQLNTGYGNIQAAKAKALSSRGGIGVINFQGKIKPNTRYQQEFNEGSMKTLTKDQQSNIEAIARNYKALTGKDLPVKMTPLKKYEDKGLKKYTAESLKKLPPIEGHTYMISPKDEIVPVENEKVQEALKAGYRNI